MNNTGKLKHAKGILAFVVLIFTVLFFSFLLAWQQISDRSYVALISISIFGAAIIYFREQISRLMINFKTGSLELELEKFEEDIVNALIIKQKLLEISTGRWDGPPEKMRQILDMLGKQADGKVEKYSGAMKHAQEIIKIYHDIDSMPKRKVTETKSQDGQESLDQLTIKLNSAFDNFLQYLNER